MKRSKKSRRDFFDKLNREEYVPCFYFSRFLIQYPQISKDYREKVQAIYEAAEAKAAEVA